MDPLPCTGVVGLRRREHVPAGVEPCGQVRANATKSVQIVPVVEQLPEEDTAAAGGGVRRVVGGVQRGLPHGERVAHVSPPAAEDVQCPGEVPYDMMAAEGNGGVLRGQEGGVLGLQRHGCHLAHRG